MTTLSPRLAHLLIHEDRSTGHLILPNGSKIRDASSLSPPLSPLSHGYDTSPVEPPKSLSLPPTTTLLPPPRLGLNRRPSHQSIFSILNEARQQSPPSSASSSGTAPLPPLTARSDSYAHEHGRHSLSPPRPSPASIRPSSYENRGGYFVHQQHQPPVQPSDPSIPRPDMFRRHSSHPYEYSPASRPGPYTTGGLEESGQMSGSRAPISRTTKACNACRSRKVRCDAGGSQGGEPSTCSRCREAGVECVYSGPQKKRGPCPGTVRPSTSNRSRRPSHRSSVTSVVTTIMTPPSEDEWSSRSSYGFLPGHTHSYPSSRPVSHDHYPKPRTPTSAPLARPSMPVLSWPGMQPAMEIDETSAQRRPVSGDPHKVFRPDYTMRPLESSRQTAPSGFDDRKLPPLRVAIERRDSYYTP